MAGKRIKTETRREIKKRLLTGERHEDVATGFFSAEKRFDKY